MEVPKEVIFVVGAILLLAVGSMAFMGLTEGGLKDSLDVLTKLIRYKRIDITSPEQLEQLLLCLHQRAVSCDSVNTAGFWTLLEDTPLKGCPCGGEYMAGTDIFVNFKFTEVEEYTIPESKPEDKYAEFEVVEDFDLKCNLRVKDQWWGETVAHLIRQSAEFLLFYDPNEDHKPLTIYNDTQGIVVVNTRRTLGDRLAEAVGRDPSLHIKQGCIVINKKDREIN